jgi:hypothetical protein
MIVIPANITQGFKDGPSRQLTAQELLTVTSGPASVGNDYVWYEGDEPAPSGPDLAEIKKQLRDAVDVKTSADIYAGFTFRGVVFSMSDNAQKNWAGIKLAVDPVLDFPYALGGKDDVNIQIVMLQGMSDLDEFCRTVYLFKKNLQQQGTAQKIQVNACTTIAQVQALAAQWGLSL